MTLVACSAGTAILVGTDGTYVSLQASFSSPPGSVLDFTLEGAEAPYRIKVRGCKKTADGEHAFRIEGRFVSLTREQREAVTRAATASPSE